MKQPPRGARFETVKMIKVEFFSGVLGRLHNEVGIYFKLLHDKYASDPDFAKNVGGVGFWAGIRLMMPVVESLSHTIGKSPQEFLGQDLNVPSPYLTWDLFRHALTHNDLMQHAKYQSKEVGWGISMIGQGHVTGSGHVSIDVLTLYQDLVNYLEGEIRKKDLTQIDVEVGVIYQNPRQQIIDEFDRL